MSSSNTERQRTLPRHGGWQSSHLPWVLLLKPNSLECRLSTVTPYIVATVGFHGGKFWRYKPLILALIGKLNSTLSLGQPALHSNILKKQRKHHNKSNFSEGCLWLRAPHTSRGQGEMNVCASSFLHFVQPGKWCCPKYGHSLTSVGI